MFQIGFISDTCREGGFQTCQGSISASLGKLNSSKPKVAGFCTCVTLGKYNVGSKPVVRATINVSFGEHVGSKTAKGIITGEGCGFKTCQD